MLDNQNSEIDKWAMRRKDAGEFEGNANELETTLEKTRIWNKEYLKEFCASCIYFIPDKGYRFQNSEGACRLNQVDLAGQCWNFTDREETKFALFMASQVKDILPIISLPTDKKRLKNLKMLADPSLIDDQSTALEIYRQTLAGYIINDGLVDTANNAGVLLGILGKDFNFEEFVKAVAGLKAICQPDKD